MSRVHVIHKPSVMIQVSAQYEDIIDVSSVCDGFYIVRTFGYPDLLSNVMACPWGHLLVPTMLTASYRITKRSG